MRVLLQILVFTGAMIASMVVAFFVTWLAWELWIPERAFHCTDDGFSIGFWTSANLHETGGDKILPGWTWEKLDRVNNLYEAVFFVMWIGGGLGAFHVSRTILRDYIWPPGLIDSPVSHAGPDAIHVNSPNLRGP